jgi:hypothetical protein
MATKIGVTSYVHATATIDIYFPDGQVKCKFCQQIRFEEAYQRYSCRLTGEWLLSPFTGIGPRCPLTFEGGANERELEDI